VNQAGMALLGIAALASLAGLFLSLAGDRRRSAGWTRAGRYSLYVLLGAAAAAMLVLLAAFLSHDFSNVNVYGHTSRALSVAYTISALWAGNAGSLLLWLLLLAVFAVIAVRSAQRRDPGFAAMATAILSVMTLFFSLLLLFGPDCNPFAANPVSPTPADGLGLNPQLQNPGMIIHPLALYAGYVVFAAPFALMLAGLVKKLPLDSWIAPVRAWVLVGWLFLTIGNAVGAWWAYVTLGWGGYWGWDPVENASLIPWLTATALLHAVSIARRRNRQKNWMAWLLAITFMLTVFGTFLTRTGVATSVHAFEGAGLIPWFVVFMVIMAALAVVVLVRRSSELRTAPTPGRITDEPVTFVVTNILLSILTFVVFWGVVFPPIVNAVSSRKIELGLKYFNLLSDVLGPIILAVLAFCMLARVARGSWRRLLVDSGIAVVFGIVVLVVLVVAGVTRGFPLVAFTLSAIAVGAIVIATIHTGLGWKRRRTYGMLLIHIGLAMVVIAIAGSWAYKTSSEDLLSAGKSLTLGDAQVTFVKMETTKEPDRDVTRAILDLTLDGKPAGQLVPRLEYYPASDQTWTRVARRSSAEGDIYVTVLATTPADNTVNIRVESHPLIVWLWVGSALMTVGGLVALLFGRRPAGAKRASAGGEGVLGAEGGSGDLNAEGGAAAPAAAPGKVAAQAGRAGGAGAKPGARKRPGR
jgi:cytochrome c-type biogenesis protein CcmF